MSDGFIRNRKTGWIPRRWKRKQKINMHNRNNKHKTFTMHTVALFIWLYSCVCERDRERLMHARTRRLSLPHLWRAWKMTRAFSENKTGLIIMSTSHWFRVIHVICFHLMLIQVYFQLNSSSWTSIKCLYHHFISDTINRHSLKTCFMMRINYSGTENTQKNQHKNIPPPQKKGWVTSTNKRKRKVEQEVRHKQEKANYWAKPSKEICEQ